MKSRTLILMAAIALIPVSVFGQLRRTESGTQFVRPSSSPAFAGYLSQGINWVQGSLVPGSQGTDHFYVRLRAGHRLTSMYNNGHTGGSGSSFLGTQFRVGGSPAYTSSSTTDTLFNRSFTSGPGSTIYSGSLVTSSSSGYFITHQVREAGSPATYRVGYNVLSPNALVSGTTSFGNVRIGTSATANLTFRNTTGGGTFLANATINSTAGNDIVLNSGTSVGNVSSSTSRSFSFTPDSFGSQTESISFGSSSSSSFDSHSLSGTGVGPDFEFTSGSTVALGAVGRNAELNGAGSAGFLNNVANISTALTGLTIRDVQIVGDDADLFRITGGFGQQLLQGGQSGSLGIDYVGTNGTGIGQKNATLRVFTDQGAALGGIGETFQFALTANATLNNLNTMGGIVNSTSDMQYDFVDVDNGGTLNILNNSTMTAIENVTVGQGGTLSVEDGSALSVNGAMSVDGMLNVDGTVGTGNGLNVRSGGTMNLASTSSLLGGLTVSDGGTVTALGTTTFNAPVNLEGGTMDLETLDLVTNGNNFNMTGGTLEVETILGDFEQNGGTLAPGDSPGLTDIQGDYDLIAGTIEFELEGTNRGIDYDAIDVSGMATLDGGTMDINFTNGFAASLGDTFQLVSAGSFGGGLPMFDFSGAVLGSGLFWDTNSFLTNGSISVTSAVPEPTSFTMFGIGCLLLGRRRRA